VTTIRAVPKTYSGVRFRSTLEADWAYNLDLMGIVWQYEPEAVQLPSGDLYRCDFYLPELTTWLEVKGPHDERIGKVREFAETVMHHPDHEIIQCDCVERRSEYPPITSGHYEPCICRVYSKEYSQTCVGLSDILYGSDHMSGCQEGTCDCWGGPWRLVVIGRAAIRGRMVWEAPSDGWDIHLSACKVCRCVHFREESGGWRCRGCGAHGKDSYHGEIRGYEYPAWTHVDPTGKVITFDAQPVGDMESGEPNFKSLPWTR
jgi:hypothetical protein